MFNKKSQADEMIDAHAKVLRIEFQILKVLYQGKTCPNEVTLFFQPFGSRVFPS